MQVKTEDVPHVPDEQRLEIDERGKSFYTILVRYAFMDEPNVMRALPMQVEELPYKSNGDLIFYRAREATASISPHARIWALVGPELFVFPAWRDRLFIFLSKTSPWMPPNSFAFFRTGSWSWAGRSKFEAPRARP